MLTRPAAGFALWVRSKSRNFGLNAGTSDVEADRADRGGAFVLIETRDR